MIITAGVMIILLIFFFAGVGKESKEGETKDKIDVLLYENLGVNLGSAKISDSEQVYTRDEFVQPTRSAAMLEANKKNPILKTLTPSDAVKGFAKRATVFTIIQNGIQKRTLVEIRFQAERDVELLKIVESMPKTTANGEEILLTKGGVLAERDPVLVFSYPNVKAGQTLKAMYVINKEVKTLPTLTFPAEDKKKKEVTEEVNCGDGKCVEGESYLTCCKDCGCTPGSVCDNNYCTPADRDRCSTDQDCDDGNAGTIDICSGMPKTCQNNPTTECVTGDMYCPEGCTNDMDSDCAIPEESTAPEEEPTGGEAAAPEISGTQQSPKITSVKVTPDHVKVGDEFLIEANVTDPNGKDDLTSVWVEILELAQVYGEIADLNDDGEDGDIEANDNIYSIMGVVSDYYTPGDYHAVVYAQDSARNKKKMQGIFYVDRTPESGTEE